MALIIFILIVWVLPLFIAYRICKNRHRKIGPPMWCAFFFGWLAVIFLLCLLEDRS